MGNNLQSPNYPRNGCSQVSSNPNLSTFTVKLCVHLLIPVLCLLYFAVTAVSAGTLAPRVNSLQLLSVGAKDPTTNRVPIVVSINGDGFGDDAAKISVRLVSKKTGEVFTASVESAANDLILVKASVPLAKYGIVLTIRGGNVDTAAGYEIELEEEEKSSTSAAATPFEITFETFKSEAYPNLYSLLITNKSEGEGFSTDPNLMKVDIVPAGATNVTVQPGSNPRNMMVTFIAPEKFEVKGLLITVYDQKSSLNAVRPVRFATPFKEKAPKADPNQPQITAIDILSLQRRNGMGRLKIEGSGFGDYERPPIAGERELLCCLNRPQRAYERDKTKNDDERLTLRSALFPLRVVRKWPSGVVEWKKK